MGKHKNPRHVWTAAEDRVLRRRYPDSYAKDIARQLGVLLQQVHRRARQLGLRKSDAFLRRELAAQGRRLRKVGAPHRFQKGIVPANKGLRRPGWYSGRMRETQFKKGQFPVGKDPEFYVLGALRVNTDGYIDMRVSFAPGALGWRALHKIIWEDAHGPIPHGHLLRFRNGDKLDVCLENLELITLAENCRRNSIHRLPPPLRQVIQLKGQLKRRVREAHDKRSARHAV